VDLNSALAYVQIIMTEATAQKATQTIEVLTQDEIDQKAW